jgi:hypothetical protein
MIIIYIYTVASRVCVRVQYKMQYILTYLIFDSLNRLCMPVLP